MIFFGKTTSSCYIIVDNHHSDPWLEVSGLRALKLEGAPRLRGAPHHQPPEKGMLLVKQLIEFPDETVFPYILKYLS